MTRSRRKSLLTAAAVLAGVVFAFLAGLQVGRSPSPPSDTARPRGGTTSVRDRYSPALLSDPYFLDQQRRLVETLEASCRALGDYCKEARAARRRLTELERGR